MPLNTMNDLLIQQLSELYAAEKHSLRVLPKLEKSASEPALMEALASHIAATEHHVERLDSVFLELDAKPKRIESEGMKGLLEDCLSLAESSRAEPHVRDAAIIAVAQHVEHDEIAGYGCARTWATLLGATDAAAKLETTLGEEHKSDAELTKIAERLNREAPLSKAV